MALQKVFDLSSSFTHARKVKTWLTVLEKLLAQFHIISEENQTTVRPE
jgi:hypothetical protein